MKNVFKIISISVIASLAVFSSCKKDEDKDPTTPAANNPQEQITTVILTGYDHDNPNDVSRQFSVVWEDLDGDGGKAPKIDSLLLDTGIEYHVRVILLDKTKTPWDTISNEVEEEKDVHQFFYTPSSSLAGKLAIEIEDYDDNNLPVGLEFHLNTLSTASYNLPVLGSLNVVLSHYDGIPKTTARSPESDIDINFPVRLK